MRRAINKCEIEVLYKYRLLIRKQHGMLEFLPESPKAERYEVELDYNVSMMHEHSIRIGTLKHMREYLETHSLDL